MKHADLFLMRKKDLCHHNKDKQLEIRTKSTGRICMHVKNIFIYRSENGYYIVL